jgi:hypothetical protein
MYLLTWNVNGNVEAHNLARDHLARKGAKELFVACFQELPATSDIAGARVQEDKREALLSSSIAVVPGAAGKLVSGLAIAHHPALVLSKVQHDPDGEFSAAIFQLPLSIKTLGIIGLHAKSKIDMRHPEDHGAFRALLRHAINELRFACDYQVVLGDFNSAIDSHEIRSPHCFYALAGPDIYWGNTSLTSRRGVPHVPFYTVMPANSVDGNMGTFVLKDYGTRRMPIVDFIAVDDATRAGANSNILTTMLGKSLWDLTKMQPALSDHLPVEGSVDI